MRLCSGAPKIDFSFLLNLYPVREAFTTIDEIKEGFKALLYPAEYENSLDEDLQDLIRDTIRKKKGGKYSE